MPPRSPRRPERPAGRPQRAPQLQPRPQQLRPKQPTLQQSPPQQPPPISPAETPERLNLSHQPITGSQPGIRVKAPRRKRRLWIWILAATLVLLAAITIAGWLRYQHELSPVGTDTNEHVTVTVEAGSTPTDIGRLLAEKEVIRSSLAFDIYTRLGGYRNSLQAGTYRLTPSDSTPEIVNHLLNGAVDTFSITFYPGATLVDNTDTPEDKKYDVTTVLRKAGFSDKEITDALGTQYSSPVFADKPIEADLEGYIYGETYQLNSGATVEDALKRAFQQLESVIVNNDLVNKYKAKGLTLFEGITLASIVQREVSDPADQPQVAQVFLTRLAQDMELGSDVTYQYIADKEGLVRDPTLDSPYNTRRYPGLPPGPISAPGKSALLAVANPAQGDYLYFLSGDDDVTYFARTLAEHEANIVNHCQKKCLIN